MHTFYIMKQSNDNIFKSALFSVNSCHVGTSARVTLSIIKNFAFFVKTISKKHPLHLSRTATPSTFRTLLVLFMCFLTLHNSAVMQKLYERSAFLHVPKFIIAPLLRVAVKSVTKNKISGFTTGDLKSDFDLKSIIDVFVSSSQLEWQEAFADSEFSFLFDGPLKMFRFKLDVLNHLASLGLPVEERKRNHLKSMSEGHVKLDQLDDPDCITRSDESGNEQTFYSFRTSFIDYTCVPKDFDLVEFLQKSLMSFPSIFKYGDKVEYYSGTVSIQHLNDLGIYKFRSTSSEHVYLVQQSMLSKVNETSIEMFASFLRIFSPTFDSSSNLIAGDISITVEETPLEQAWDSYLNFNISDYTSFSEGSSPKKTKTKFKNKGPRGSSSPSVISDSQISPSQPIETRTYSTSSKPDHRLFYATGRLGTMSLELSFIHKNEKPGFRIVRSFHSSRHFCVDIPGLTSAYFAIKSVATAPAVCPTPSAMYPGVNLWSVVSGGVKVAVSKTVANTLPSLSLVFAVVVLSSVGYYLTKHLSEVGILVSEYNHIMSVSDGAFTQYLFTKYPDLSLFNQRSVELLFVKGGGSLSLDQCNVLVRFYIENQIHKVWGILLDSHNGQFNLA
jgi:hypothetical protein